MGCSSSQPIQPNQAPTIPSMAPTMTSPPTAISGASADSADASSNSLPITPAAASASDPSLGLTAESSQNFGLTAESSQGLGLTAESSQRALQFSAMLTHDWGSDELGRSNHSRVALVAKKLREAGLKVWFDEDEMRGDVNRQMADGIERSACVIVFITRTYLLKASGEGENGDDDNCKFEFDYALRRTGVARMVSVVMEPKMRDPRLWTGVVGGKLGGKLFVDLAEDGEAFDHGIARLASEVRTVEADALKARESLHPGGSRGGHPQPQLGSSGAHPQPRSESSAPRIDWPAQVVMDGQPFGLQGWNGTFVRTPEEMNGRPTYRRANVTLLGGLLPILPVELWWVPAQNHWALHRDIDRADKHVIVSLHSNTTPVGRWERGVNVRLA